MSRQGYIYNKSEDSTKANILIDGEIDAWWGTGLRSLALDISNSGASDIMIQINSEGGSVFEGQAIANYIKGSPYNISTTVVGLCASIATMFAMEGKTTSIAKYSRFMIHNVSIQNLSGGSEDLRLTADFMDTLNLDLQNRYVSTIISNGKIINESAEDTRAQVKDWMEAETYFTAEEAVKYGFIQKMVDGAEFLNKANAQKILNSCSKYKNVPTDFINNIQNIVNMADEKPTVANEDKESKGGVLQAIKNYFSSDEGKGQIIEAHENAESIKAQRLEAAKALLASNGLQVVAKTVEVTPEVEAPEVTKEKTPLEILQAKLEASELKAQRLEEEAKGAPSARAKELDAENKTIYTKKEMEGFASLTNAIKQR